MTSTVDLDFEILYKISVTAMKINNSHPAIPRTKLWFLIFAIQHAYFTLTLVMLFKNTFDCVKKGDFSAACKHGYICVMYVVITFKHITLTMYRKLILNFIETIKIDYKKDRPCDEKMIVYKYAMSARKVCVFWLYLTLLSGFSFPLKHFIFEVYYTIINGEFKLIELYPMTYPTVIEENKYHPLVFGFIYFTVCYFICYCAISYISLVPFGPICILHACALLEIAKKRIEELKTDNIEEFKTKLEKIAQILQHVYRYLRLRQLLRDIKRFD